MQNSLFKRAYLCKTAYYDLFLKKQLIQNNLFIQNNLLGSLPIHHDLC